MVARAEAVRLAKRVVDLSQELIGNQVEMIGLIRTSKAAELLDKIGVGPVTAGWSTPRGRMRAESVPKRHSLRWLASARSLHRQGTPLATG